MPRKFVLVSNLESIESRFHVSLSAYARLLPPAYGISGGDLAYVLTMERPQELQAYRFGMTPYWAKSPMELINARAEGDKNPNNDPGYSGPKQIFMKKAFLKPVQCQRCLVLADAYYDWDRAKKPYLVYLQDKQRPFAMAGLYDYWKDHQTKEILASFAIITTTANQLLQSIGVKRMPVILTPGYEKDWLKPDRSLSEVLHMLRQFPSQKMNAYPVSDLVDQKGVNDIAMIRPVGDRLQSEVRPVVRPTVHNRYYHKKKDAPQGSWGASRMKDQE
ncbi:MAG: SOS response-associated peptidase [Bacteroidales bacterium]